MAEPITPIQSVLCAIDLSDISPHVLSMAAEFAEAHEAKLLVMHSVEVWDSRYDFIVEDMRKRLEKDAAERVHAEVARLGKSKDAPVEAIVCKGAASPKVLETIRLRRPDLVVVGSHGRRGLDNLLLGNVAEKIVRASPVSVLVVRPPRNPDIGRIVCAVDFSECSRTALERAMDVARLMTLSAVSVLNVYEVPLGYMEAGMTYETALVRTREIHQHELDEFLKPYASGDIKCAAAVEEGPPASTIVKYAQQNGADLLVIGSHGRSRLTALVIGGTSTRVVHRSSVPVLAVKSPQHAQTLWEALDKL